MKHLPIFAMALLALAFASCRQSNEAAPAADTTAPAVAVADSIHTADLPAMEAQPIANFKGGEGELLMKLYQEGDTKVMLCTMPAGSSVGYHRHDGSMEVIYVQRGEATICYDSTTTATYTVGQAHYCPNGHGHSIANLGPGTLVIYNVVASQQ